MEIINLIVIKILELHATEVSPGSVFHDKVLHFTYIYMKNRVNEEISNKSL